MFCQTAMTTLAHTTRLPIANLLRGISPIPDHKSPYARYLSVVLKNTNSILLKYTPGFFFRIFNINEQMLHTSISQVEIDRINFSGKSLKRHSR